MGVCFNSSQVFLLHIKCENSRNRTCFNSSQVFLLQTIKKIKIRQERSVFQFLIGISLTRTGSYIHKKTIKKFQFLIGISLTEVEKYEQGQRVEAKGFNSSQVFLLQQSLSHFLFNFYSKLPFLSMISSKKWVNLFLRIL